MELLRIILAVALSIAFTSFSDSFAQDLNIDTSIIDKTNEMMDKSMQVDAEHEMLSWEFL